MKVYSIKENSLRFFAAFLKQGKTLVYPTETAYGLGCDPLSEMGVKAVYEIKKRPKNMYLPLIASSVSMVRKWCEFPQDAQDLARDFWPGPLTLILSLRTETTLQKKMSKYLHTRTVAIRVSSCDFARELAHALGRPIISTSANISGRASLYTSEDIRKEFENEQVKPFAFVDAGNLMSKPVSTILDCTSFPFAVIRQGKISIPKQYLS